MEIHPDTYCPGCGVMGGAPCLKNCERAREMRQPFIYTMPEQFMDDTSVPIKWRLYGVINGFWIAGKPVYATNNFFSKRLNCTERHISRALEELENERLLTRDIEGFKRYILQGGVTSGVRGGRRGASGGDDVGGQHISYNLNSINKLTSNSKELQIVEITTEEEDRPPRTKRDTSYKVIFQLWGKYPANWDKNTTQIQAAKNLLAERGVNDVREALNYAKKHQGEDFFPVITSPWDLDSKWLKLVELSLKK